MVTIRDSARFSLGNVTLDALTAYARAEGWAKSGTFWKYSDIYTADGKPRIVIPRADEIDDYELAVEDLIVAFSKVSGRDEDSIYRELAAADCDGLRFRAVEADDEGLPFEAGYALLNGARNLIAAADSSLGNRRSVYRSGANGAGADYLKRLRLGPTERDGFTLVLTSKPIATAEFEETSPDRQAAERLSEALRYARSAITKTELGDKGAFERAAKHGVSANMCVALADLAEGVSSFDISFRWAITRPSKHSCGPVAFSDGDAPILREAALTLGAVQPHPSPPPSRGRGVAAQELTPPNPRRRLLGLRGGGRLGGRLGRFLARGALRLRGWRRILLGRPRRTRRPRPSL